MEVLLVEDELGRNKTYVKALRQKGWEVSFASNVGEALTALERGGFDLAIVDLNIPLGPGGVERGLAHCDLNGKYVVEAVFDDSSISVGEVVCWTNYWERAEEELRAYPVRILPKRLTAREFLERL